MPWRSVLSARIAADFEAKQNKLCAATTRDAHVVYIDNALFTTRRGAFTTRERKSARLSFVRELSFVKSRRGQDVSFVGVREGSLVGVCCVENECFCEENNGKTICKLVCKCDK